MRAGELRHLVIIQQMTETQNAYGESVRTWAEFAQACAAVEPLSGREYFDSQQRQADVTTRITLRYRAGIVPRMRVLFGARVYEIDSVIDIEERHREMQLMCAEQIGEAA